MSAISRSFPSLDAFYADDRRRRHSRERAGGRRRLRARGDEGGVERADRGPDEQVGRHAVLVEPEEHPGLGGAERGAAREHERGAHRLSSGRP